MSLRCHRHKRARFGAQTATTRRRAGVWSAVRCSIFGGRLVEEQAAKLLVIHRVDVFRGQRRADIRKLAQVGASAGDDAWRSGFGPGFGVGWRSARNSPEWLT